MLVLTARFAPPDFPYINDYHSFKKPAYYRPSYKDLLYAMRDFGVLVFNEHCI